MDQLWDSMVEFQHAIAATDTERSDISIDLEQRQPVAIVPMGDWHIGNRGTDYQRLKHDLALVKSTAGAYVVSTGDEFDNYLESSPKGGKFEALVPPDIQKKLATHLLEGLDYRLLAQVQACHPDWERGQTGFSWSDYVANKCRIQNLGYGGTLHITVGEQTYKVALRHRYARDSKNNPLATLKSYIIDHGHHDVVVLGHYHTPSVVHAYLGDFEACFVRAGSFKIFDRYAQKLGGWKGVPENPVIILYPDEHKVIAVLGLQQGLNILKSLRGS